jgi:hypothetical protein
MTTPTVWGPDYTTAAGSPHSHTFLAGADIVAGQLIMIEAGEDDTVIPAVAAAGSPYVGVAANNTPAGFHVTVLTGGGVIHESPLTVAGTAGQFAASGAGGAVAPSGAPITVNTLGVLVRGGDPGATPPVPCRWLSYR